jgi:acetyltransferase-like isoleucine patch superfamily enzyme
VDIRELERLLGELYRAKDARLAEQHHRSLPFQDAMFDRWERAKRLGFAEGASVYNSALVYGDVKAGRNTWVGPYTLLDGSGGGIQIGDYCSIAAGVHIYTHDTVLWALSGGRAAKRTGPVCIGNCVYIGSQSVITVGVSIGARSVISANSLVNQDVDEGVVVAGTPARRIGWVQGTGADVQVFLDART